MKNQNSKNQKLKIQKIKISKFQKSKFQKSKFQNSKIPKIENRKIKKSKNQKSKIEKSKNRKIEKTKFQKSKFIKIYYNIMVNYKKCPPGFICIENATMIFIIFIICIFLYIIHCNINNHFKKRYKDIPRGPYIPPPPPPPPYIQTNIGYIPHPNNAYTNIPGDVLLNPYEPPLNDERYLVPNRLFVPPGRIPINIDTNPGVVNTNFRQVGLLTPHSHKKNTENNKMIPLMGRPLFINRDMWQYYTMSDQNNSIKLPVFVKNRSCMNEYGCNQLYTGDKVFVEGYNQLFKVSIYDGNGTPYIPYL